MSNKMISDKSILIALPRVALTPAWLRAKSMLTELHSRLQQTATHQQHQSNRQLRPFWCLVLQQTSVKFRSEMWTEHRPRLFAGWYLFSVLSPVQTPADKCKTVRWQWSMLWYPVVVVVSVGDDQYDLWLLVQGLGLRTKLAPLQYQLNGCLQVQQALENRDGGGGIIFLTFKSSPARTNHWI